MKDKFDNQSIDWSVLKHLYQYAKNKKNSFVILIIVMIAFALVDVAVPYLMMYAIENYIVPKSMQNISWFILVFIVVATLRSWLVAVMINVGGKLNHSIVYQIRSDCFNHLQNLSLSFFDHHPTGWLMARLTSDCTILGSTLSWGIVDIVWGIAMMAFMSIVMLLINWKIALAILVIIPMLYFVSFYFKRFMLDAYRTVRELNSELTGKINEGIMGARTIKTLVHEKSSLDAFDKNAQDLAKFSFAAANRSAFYLPLILVIGGIGSMLALYFGGNEVILFNNSKGQMGISYGVLVAFLAYAVKFFQPIQDIANRFAEFQNAQAAAERVLGILNIKPEIADNINLDLEKFDQSTKIGDIEFKNLKFAYNDSEPLFEEFNLTIKAGTSLAIVGHTGSGKTTLTNLLARFYQPTS
ncbi:MAG: ABC transporter transmembrane domain-containing protein, partial [Lentisphaeria bacterium]